MVIKVVHVINSCHLDLGFADSSAGIINRYFDHHLPTAAAVGAELAGGGVKGYTDHKLNFMFQSWVLDLFLDCPKDMGIHCPTNAAKNTVRDAIEKGHITWHAVKQASNDQTLYLSHMFVSRSVQFPHNAQLEIMGSAMIEAGLELTVQHARARPQYCSALNILAGQSSTARAHY